MSDVSQAAQAAASINMAGLTVDQLRQQRPDLIEAIERGVDTKPIVEAARKDGEATGRAAGAEAERARIAGIEALAIKGHEKLISDLKADGKTTPEQAAMKIIEAAKAAGHEHIAALNEAEQDLKNNGGVATSPTANPAIPAKPDTAKPDDEEAWKKEGFASKEDHAAFVKASAEGRAKIFAPRAAAQ